MTAFGFFATSLVLYFLPAIIGFKKRSASGIFVLNLLLGWTIVGWIACLVWALTADPLPVTPPQLQQAWLCTRCQSPLDRAQRFCSRCGNEIAWPVAL